MQILIAEDDPVSRLVLERTLQKWGHEPVPACDGQQAWEVLRQPSSPYLAILDWMMPEIDGTELCRRVRAMTRDIPIYIILLTARHQKEDVVIGLESGADDYIIKPFHHQELRSRIHVAERIIALQRGLSERVRELESALAQVKQLKGLLPICSYCKKVRDDSNYWQQVEQYFGEHSDLQFTHGICPSCWTNVVQPELARAGIQDESLSSPYPSHPEGGKTGEGEKR